MLNYLLVFLGGGLGSIARYGVSRLLTKHTLDFPLATLIANVLSCLILGYCFGLMLKNEMSSTVKLLIMTGFCGGFSTFSTFSLESIELLNADNFSFFLLNTLGSVFVGIVCIYLGVKFSGAY